MKKILLILVAMIFTNSIYAQDVWVPYRAEIVSPQPAYLSYSQPTIYYQAVPYYNYQTTVVEHRCMFHVRKQIITKPIIQWVYQPVIIYK